MIKAYKYRLNPNEEQRIFFEKSFGCARYVYNWGLNLRNEAYQKDGTRIGWVEICKQMTNLKKQEETSWLNEVSIQSLQSSIRNMDSAFTRFFREKKGFPKFKVYYTVKLKKKYFCETRERHFYMANKILKEDIFSNKKLRSKFSKSQIKQISQYETPSGYTWHHHQDVGVLQLVDAELHSKTHHAGGYTIWGSKK